MANLRGKKTILLQYVAAAILVLALLPGLASAEQSGKQATELGPGSAHPGTTGEVRLELEEFLLAGDPHACGIIWDLTVDEKKGELYVLCEPKRVGGVGEVRVFGRSGEYLRTIMPLNPTLPRSSVNDICDEVVLEDGTELIVPKFDLSWGEPSFYGTFWDSHKKIALAPDGDLLISDLYRGKIMRMGTDGSLPEEGWHTGYAVHVGGARGSAIVNYLPFDSLRYPYFHFGPDGSLYVSGGQSCFESRYHHYNLEGGVNNPKYHFPIEGDRSGYVWKLGLKPGPKAEKLGVVGGFHQASGIVVDGDHIVVADAGNSRIQVCTIDGEVVASITHYMDNGKQQRILDPTALAIDRDKCLYVLVGSQERPEDLRTERGVRQVQDALHASAFEELPPPRKVIKLKSWKSPELLAESAPVHTYVMQIAVDAGVSPPLVYVANGGGPGSLQQLSGADLSLKAQWQDDGKTLSNPRQDSGMPILNIDPETGHVYVEDDARYRHKKFGTAYRLDQQGNILKTWDPYFIDIEESGLISPWGATNLERGFAHPEEPLFLDSIFGKDGKVYRWRLSEEGVSILRFDRAGNPLPFASTGKHELLVDPVPIKGRLYQKAHLRKNFTCWWDVYSGMDIDREGNIYYANKLDRYVESGMMLPNYALHRQLDVYDATGKLTHKALLDLTSVKGIQVDEQGYLYIVHIPADGRPFEKRVDRAKARAPKRFPMRPFAVTKFSPTGEEIWSQPWDGDHGMGFIPPNPHCICSTHRVNQALDDKGYIYMATKHSVQVMDTETGKVVGEFGSYGNADCRGKGSKYPHPELPFGTISSLAVWKDKLFVMDVLNRRLVKLNIVYDPSLKRAISSNLNAVPADEIDWEWPTPPTFPNEAYGPRTDVNPDLIGDNHLFDVWVPEGDGPYPVMIYAHGGGFKSGSKVKAIGGRPKLAEDDIVFISINYTLGQGGAVAVQDGIDAIKYIKANHKKYKIDPEKIFLSGNSAGGIMMNYIIYDLKMPGILGAWHGAYYRTQFADLSIDNLREVGIPIAISMSKLYPADPGHSPLAAVTLLERNVAAGNSGMWIGSTGNTVEQVWLNGKWIINANDGINTGESYPDGAEWIHSISSHGVTQAELSGLDAVMLRAIEQGKIKGCSFLVAHKGRIVYKKAHGAFTTEEQVPLASVSKPFAASVIMALVEQGKLDLEDPVEKYLPEFKGIRVKGSETPARPMTIRHVLSHMAGFWGNKGISREKIGLIRDFSQTLEESVLGAAQYELISEPGTKWTYSGIGYCVAGRVAEAALGDQSFEKVAQDALFRPMGMNDTTYAPTPERPFILVGGSLRSTLDDMAVFGQMHLNDGVYNGTQFLSKASVTEQRRLQIPEERFRAPGLGWHRGFPDKDGLADLLFISGASGPRFQVDRRRQTVTVFLVRSSLQKVVPIFEDLNQHVEQIFPEVNDR